MSGSSHLPSFKLPPVIETVLGVQFDPVPGLNPAHFGLFWREYLSDWPNLTDAPSLDPQFETFGTEPPWGRRRSLRLTVTEKSPFRLQIRNERNDRMVQVQNGRFHFNWMKGAPNDEYPRYSTIRPQFDKHLAEFQQFLQKEGLGQLQMNQWEVTYVNHFPVGTVWGKPSDWGGLLRQPQVQALKRARLETFSGNWHYEIPPERGRLHVNLQHGKRGNPPVEVLMMMLTARGPVVDGAVGLQEGLDLGRETIVMAFSDLTSPDAHAYWGGGE